MFRTAKTPRRHLKSRRFLSFESLEDRLCMAAPMLSSFSATILNHGHDVKISATIQDSNPMNLMMDSLHLTGAIQQDLMPDTNGNINATVQASSLGTVTAVATGTGGTSAQQTATLMSTPPVISSTTSSIDPNTYYFGLSGTVTAPDPASCMVVTSGIVSWTGAPDSLGNFSVYQKPQGGSFNSGIGMLYMTVTDAWGQSAEDDVQVNKPAPTVTHVTVGYGSYGYVKISGYVSDPVNPAGFPVYLSGSVNTSTVTTDKNGYWYAEFRAPQATDSSVAGLPVAQIGSFSITTTDPLGQTSQVATDQVSPPQFVLTATFATQTPLFGDESVITSASVAQNSGVGLTVTYQNSNTGVTESEVINQYGNTTFNDQAVLTNGASTPGFITISLTDWWGRSVTPIKQQLSQLYK